MYEWYSYILPSLSEAEVNGNLRLIKTYIPSFYHVFMYFLFSSILLRVIVFVFKVEPVFFPVVQ